MRRTTIMAGILGAAILVGCTHTMNLPPDFVAVDQADLGDYVLRGVSADGVVVALRRLENPKRGTLEFWTKAVANELTTGRGYKLIKTAPVESETGVPGRLIEFSAERRGVQFTYLLAIFVQGRDILIAEAGGKADLVKGQLAEITKSLLSAK